MAGTGAVASSSFSHGEDMQLNGIQCRDSQKLSTPIKPTPVLNLAATFDFQECAINKYNDLAAAKSLPSITDFGSLLIQPASDHAKSALMHAMAAHEKAHLQILGKKYDVGFFEIYPKHDHAILSDIKDPLIAHINYQTTLQRGETLSKIAKKTTAVHHRAKQLVQNSGNQRSGGTGKSLAYIFGGIQDILEKAKTLLVVTKENGVVADKATTAHFERECFRLLFRLYQINAPDRLFGNAVEANQMFVKNGKFAEFCREYAVIMAGSGNEEYERAKEYLQAAAKTVRTTSRVCFE
jgi:hypothetical protein